ncbi:hypothetical protein BDB00DRAFT_793828 [Zychaea mexicana]|uniref:uncharacterized protein n=1 Tax=Zychaea mexicana TaxID=64656 RepID=UPI0022FEAB7D|nr:uncharacterized protein BDB00DRAFT_793828 [Zychaea mexicana]KAI9467573.1 hypothetical protein BDB00DRAFT_793828 [Zychaea mexicana]
MSNNNFNDNNNNTNNYHDDEELLSPVIISVSQRPSSCPVSKYQDIILRQPEETGERWIYKGDYKSDQFKKIISRRESSVATESEETMQPTVTITIDDEKDRNPPPYFGQSSMSAIAMPPVTTDVELPRSVLSSNKVICYMSDRDTVKFKYVNDHTGHTPGTIEDVKYLPKLILLKERIIEELKKYKNVRQVRTYLQREHAHLESTKRDTYLHTVDVYNIFYKFRQEECAKDKDDFTSVKYWLQDLEHKGYHVWLYADDTGRQLLSAVSFGFGFVAP